MMFSYRNNFISNPNYFQIKSPKTLAVKFEFQFWSDTEFHPKKSFVGGENLTMFVNVSNKGLLKFHNETESRKAQVMMVDGNFTLWTFCGTTNLFSYLLSRDRYANASEVSVEILCI